jgi:glycosyltransferase involved in cell wall biosynthesis
MYKNLYKSLRKSVISGTVSLKKAFSNESTKNRLIILDDMFPNLLSSFRVAEFNAYLHDFQMAHIYSTAKAFQLFGEVRSFSEVLREYEQRYPQFRDRVSKYNQWSNLTGKLAYSVFLNNAFGFINVVEGYHMPFVFTLYPGGGFQLHDKGVIVALLRVFSSQYFRKVIVTQKIVRDYLLENNLCAPENIKFIFGGVLPVDLANRVVPKKFYGQDKNTFDICFVANKYMPRGIDKGYDVFIEVAKQLSAASQDICFHVVGPYDASDYDICGLEARIQFYGSQYTDFFESFYSNIDIILSPNVPFRLGPGSFDGFPTGACVEAGLSGVAVFCTDPLDQNIVFRDGEEIVIISRNVKEICETICFFYRDYDRLYRLSLRGQETFKRVYGFRSQMAPRLQLISLMMS